MWIYANCLYGHIQTTYVDIFDSESCNDISRYVSDIDVNCIFPILWYGRIGHDFVEENTHVLSKFTIIGSKMQHTFSKDN